MKTENHYTETDLGNISLNPRGEYAPESFYEYLDTVNFGGGSYMCLAELGTKITGIPPVPGTNTEHWQILTLPGGLTPEYIQGAATGHMRNVVYAGVSSKAESP